MLKNFTILETLFFYDDHLFFVGVTDSQQIFVAYFIERLEGRSTYLTGSFKDADLQKVKNASLDLYSFLMGLENKELCHIGSSIPTPYSEAISDEKLKVLIPSPGIFL